jgi:hypothetical protein
MCSSSSPCFAPSFVLIVRVAWIVFKVASMVCHMERKDTFVSHNYNCLLKGMIHDNLNWSDHEILITMLQIAIWQLFHV